MVTDGDITLDGKGGNVWVLPKGVDGITGVEILAELEYVLKLVAMTTVDLLGDDKR